ncbi:TlpA family protein disulfide reductase [Rathayibacter toxicus]|uniref:TlpA family protein disulfide reductase n=1 Tax=Rathayibacter toxicus TaxID=145458 RepID=A0A0C5BFM6_9MICO|nr:TlpA disulfide reductase family protein [Rathayibacter toxicus]AJM78166.1 hypothetical protein TI83_09945 [Rathayibacter toxicus]ALS57568.1 hypothetical protein APU90_07120 [Rathayibacter toxicus]KKM44924.1 hypothetical protein VT73_07285 [Rathayibacter toxicus]PPG20764.1 TlpA family protein disulfide reductase [Rathayibacter toxicus]PPG45867.1 TlpA family protein disulfide reductase [Rathayibacter toxicus]
MRRVRGVTAAAVVVGLALTGCAQDPLAEQYRSGSNKGYISGDGTLTEVAVADRGDPIVFSGTDMDGNAFDSASVIGRVTVVNFWYANCSPCRAEAASLEKVSSDFTGKNVSFVGVNVRDQAPQVAAFMKTYGLSYPSIVDNNSSVQLAFTGKVPPNAVPTTLVLDKRGRVASRILGQLQSTSLLSTLVSDALAESE